MKSTKKYFLVLTALLVGITTVGCESLTSSSSAAKKKKKDSQSWFSFKKKEYQIPQSMNVTWSHDVLTLPGKPPTRGFGGRFYFYNEKTQAVPVDGDLVVYGFDDTHKLQGTEDLNQADKRFRFTAEQFTTHFTEGELGASYSVWIPWDDAYGPQKKIMLIPTFLTKEGRLIRGAASNLNLPGKNNDPSEGIIPRTSSTIPTALPGQMMDLRNSSAGNSNLMSNPSALNTGMRTTTIQVPARTLKHSQANQTNLAAANSLGAEAMIANVPTFVQPAMAQQTAEVVPVPQTTVPNMSPRSMYTTPTSMPLNQTSIKTNHASGWAQPELPQMAWAGLAPHFSQSQPQVQASPAVQPAAYQPR